jgi:hypothetical protein
VARLKIDKKKIVKKLSRQARVPPAKVQVSKKEKHKRSKWSAWRKELEKITKEEASGGGK